MLHPNTRLVWISDKIGYGIIATDYIAKGTITFVQDNLDITIGDGDPLLNSPLFRHTIERYSYQNAEGQRVISWDFGKYMNHCCHANTLTTGYGFEIAIRDINPGEEITDDYGIFTQVHEMDIVCNQNNCRNRLNFEDFDNLVPSWDQKIKEALHSIYTIDQPLMPYVDRDTVEKLNLFFEEPAHYHSVKMQKPQMPFKLNAVRPLRKASSKAS